MKKGFSLIEVLVSISIFAVMLTTIIGCYLLANNAYIKEKEYLYFENICLEINEYSNDYNKLWNINYFKDEINIKHYDSNFKLTNKEDKYTLTYEYNNKNELIVNIKNNDKNYYIIKDLNYGSKRYV